MLGTARGFRKRSSPNFREGIRRFSIITPTAFINMISRHAARMKLHHRNTVDFFHLSRCWFFSISLRIDSDRTSLTNYPSTSNVACTINDKKRKFKFHPWKFIHWISIVFAREVSYFLIAIGLTEDYKRPIHRRLFYRTRAILIMAERTIRSKINRRLNALWFFGSQSLSDPLWILFFLLILVPLFLAEVDVR